MVNSFYKIFNKQFRVVKIFVKFTTELHKIKPVMHFDK